MLAGQGGGRFQFQRDRRRRVGLLIAFRGGFSGVMTGISARAASIAIAAHPPACADFIRDAGRPDIGAAEVRAIGIRIADGMHDRQIARVPKLLESLGGRMQSPLVVELQSGVARDADLRPRAMIIVIADRDDGVQAIIAAGQLEDDQNLVIRPTRALRISGIVRRQAMRAAIKEDRQRRGGAQQLHAAVQEKTTGKECLVHRICS